MTTNDPVTTVDARFSMEGAPAVPWPDARQALEDAGTYWLPDPLALGPLLTGQIATSQPPPGGSTGWPVMA
jgi:hypothetical protein